MYLFTRGKSMSFRDRYEWEPRFMTKVFEQEQRIVYHGFVSQCSYSIMGVHSVRKFVEIVLQSSGIF